jgi:hypothetical protein
MKYNLEMASRLFLLASDLSTMSLSNDNNNSSSSSENILLQRKCLMLACQCTVDFLASRPRELDSNDTVRELRGS